MSATNQTPNYGLPQYIGTDVPSYLGDFNKAMLDIDTAIKGVDNKATSAESSVATANANASEALEIAGTASTKADTAQATATSGQATATQAKNTAETAQSTAETAQATATQAKNTATQAQSDVTKALTDLAKFNLVNSQKISSVTPGSNVESVPDCNLTLVADSSYKVFKLYGRVSVKAIAKGYCEVSFNSNLRPSKQVVMQGCGFAYDYDTGGVGSDAQITIATSGKVTIRGNCAKNRYGNGMWLLNMLYFLDTFDQSLVPDQD